MLEYSHENQRSYILSTQPFAEKTVLSTVFADLHLEIVIVTTAQINHRNNTMVVIT